jgi:hypothetical protein
MKRIAVCVKWTALSQDRLRTSSVYVIAVMCFRFLPSESANWYEPKVEMCYLTSTTTTIARYSIVRRLLSVKTSHILVSDSAVLPFTLSSVMRFRPILGWYIPRLILSSKTGCRTLSATSGIYPFTPGLVHIAVSIVSDYRRTTGRPGFDPLQRQRIFPLAFVSRPALKPTQPPVPGSKARPGRDANHSPPSSAEVNNK